MYDEAEQQIDLYDKGQRLKTIPVNAWQTVKDIIHNYVEDQDLKVRTLKPGDTSVIAEQAALFALSAFEKYFVESSETAMDFAVRPSEEFKQYTRSVVEASDVLRAQGIQ